MDHTLYAVFVTEEQWLYSLEGVIRNLELMSLEELRRRHAALRSAAPLLTYDHPDSHALGSALLWEAKQRCDVSDEDLFPMGTILPRPRPLTPINGSRLAEELQEQSAGLESPHARALARAWRRAPAAAAENLSRILRFDG